MSSGLPGSVTPGAAKPVEHDHSGPDSGGDEISPRSVIADFIEATDNLEANTVAGENIDVTSGGDIKITGTLEEGAVL